MPGFVKAEAGGKQLEVTFSYAINLEWYLEAHITDELKEGTEITFTYSQVRIQNYAQHTWDNWRNNLGVFVCTSDFKEIRPLEPEGINRDLVIESGLAGRMRLMVPVPIQKGEEFALKISLLDRLNNAPRGPFEGAVSLRSDIRVDNLPEQIELTASDNNYKEIKGLICPGTGCGFIYAKPGSMQMAKSNLILCEAEVKEHVFFGDIHAHTSVSDGLDSPDDLYHHARYTALSDFSSVTDHNHRENASSSKPFDRYISSDAWKEILDAARKWNKDNEFVTLAGAEQSMSGLGHRNIYYPTPPDVLFTGNSVEELWEYLDEHAPDAVVIPHHTLEICKSTDYDPRYVPLIEIYSMWGSSEERYGAFWSKNIDRGISVQEILDEGHMLGIIGGSDNHHGKPDISACPSRFTNMHYRGGIAGVMCEKLTRDNIFGAFKERSVYATTGERIILRFSINDINMGRTLKVKKGEEITLKVFAGGTEDIRRIDIIKNGKLFSIHEGSGYLEQIEYADTGGEKAYYYVRLMQIDGAMAWSSPIFVNYV
jgi:hypothetical protein